MEQGEEKRQEDIRMDIFDAECRCTDSIIVPEKGTIALVRSEEHKIPIRVEVIKFVAMCPSDRVPTTWSVVQLTAYEYGYEGELALCARRHNRMLKVTGRGMWFAYLYHDWAWERQGENSLIGMEGREYVALWDWLREKAEQPPGQKLLSAVLYPHNGQWAVFGAQEVPEIIKETRREAIGAFTEAVWRIDGHAERKNCTTPEKNRPRIRQAPVSLDTAEYLCMERLPKDGRTRNYDGISFFVREGNNHETRSAPEADDRETRTVDKIRQEGRSKSMLSSFKA